MKISYELTPEDYWQFVKYYRVNNAARPSILYLLLAGLLVAFPFMILAFLSSLIRGGHHSWKLGLDALGMTGMVYSLFWGDRREARKKAEKSPRLVGQHLLYIGPLSLRDRSDTEMLAATWVSVVEVVQTKWYIFLTLSRHDVALDGFVIPKRCFSNPTEANQFFLTAVQYRHEARVRTLSSGELVCSRPPTSCSRRSGG